ncbi:hypothetical protein RIF29_30719 [Crotalaria pallida]|uniref:Bulb-type lectin domain-containing protein n=1 Tax=Crotalaria pallida TaxID=3830 RepID=A0AAN9EGW9_CROPI
MLWCSSCIHVEAAYNSSKPGDSVNATEDLCSANNIYYIRFFSFEQRYKLFYLHIASTDSQAEIVWTANRNKPYVNTSGLNLSFDHFGVLKIVSQVEKPIIIYSPPPHSTTNNMVATLLDTGNFVVQQLNPNGATKSVLWQSFDYPGHTLIPGMKLGVNHKTGHSWSLVSWVSEASPAPGPFSLEWEPKEGELNIRRRGQVIWKSGKLRHNIFENIPKESQLMFNYTIVSNHNEDYFTFTTLSETPAAIRVSWSMYQTGQLTGILGTDIARADKCYGYNTDDGCQKWEIPECRHPGDVFDVRTAFFDVQGNDTSYERNSSYGIGDCQAS